MPRVLTPARARVLGKAVYFGAVYRAGGWGPEGRRPELVGGDLLAELQARSDPSRHDRGHIIDWLVRAGFLAYGRGANAYVATPAGCLALEPRRAA